MNAAAANAPQNAPSSRTVRSVVAIVVGFLVVVVLSIATDAVMHATGVFPKIGQMMSDALFLFATAYRTFFTVLGGYITARLAPQRPMKHAFILGIVGTIAGTVGAVATWNIQPPLGPHWYSVGLAVLAIPSCWLGGLLASRRA